MEIQYQEGIIMDILIKSPVRSLLLFKCVSKSWKMLISESYFKMRHLSHAKNDLNSQKLLVRESFTSGLFNFFCFSLSTDQLIWDAQNRPSKCTPFGGDNIYSCCDGVVLLGLNYSFALPHTPFKLEYTSFGFGYDANSDDYKILKVNRGGKYFNFPTIVCPKTGSQMEIHPYYQDFTISPVVFVRGAFHWLGCSYNYSAVSFSTSNEVYRDIPLLYSNYGISVLGGTLCFYSTYNYHQDQPVTFQLWGMKEYGVVESWTELFTLRASDSYNITPKYRYADGDVLLRCSLDFRRQSCYGHVFRTSKGQLVGVSGSQSAVQEGIVYTESLISPKSLI
ncbi:hypothetical protein R3W88_028546 [Solanum pinnatisectum]|uniref:F-box domain-containing protein n=1 Tax=Solanum pinnatisectum TaxID=50273 RepID=A0AAV9K2S0_9SOLN|nr:hypothetical protein R3W88_028546 [Solanum pinnatisectum]